MSFLIFILLLCTITNSLKSTDFTIMTNINLTRKSDGNLHYHGTIGPSCGIYNGKVIYYGGVFGGDGGVAEGSNPRVNDYISEWDISQYNFLNTNDYTSFSGSITQTQTTNTVLDPIKTLSFFSDKAQIRYACSSVQCSQQIGTQPYVFTAGVDVYTNSPGAIQTQTNNMIIYDLANNKYIPGDKYIENMPITQYESCVTSDATSIYVIGGSGIQKIYKYTPPMDSGNNINFESPTQQDSWTDMGSLGATLTSPGCTFDRRFRYLYIFGGKKTGTIDGTIFYIDINEYTTSDLTQSTYIMGGGAMRGIDLLIKVWRSQVCWSSGFASDIIYCAFGYMADRGVNTGVVTNTAVMFERLYNYQEYSPLTETNLINSPYELGCKKKSDGIDIWYPQCKGAIAPFINTQFGNFASGVGYDKTTIGSSATIGTYLEKFCLTRWYTPNSSQTKKIRVIVGGVNITTNIRYPIIFEENSDPSMFTASPTLIPSKIPTKIPTGTPSKLPTSNTKAPAVGVTNPPTKNPVKAGDPTEGPTKSPVMKTTIAQGAKKGGLTGQQIAIIAGSVAGGVILIVIIVVVILCVKKNGNSEQHFGDPDTEMYGNTDM